MLTFDDLVSGFQKLGLERGDVLLVHSSYKSFGGVEGGAQTVIDALLSILGEEGTLIMPTFNFDFCKGEPWDVRNTPSHMGIITELVRNDPRSCRVFHPIYSFAIIGEHQETLCSINEKSSYGKNSLFGKLRELDSKMMIIGLDYTNSLTFFHHVEEMEGVGYRYIKAFTGEVTDWEGNSYEDTFYMLVRDLEKGVITEVNPMGALMEQVGIVQVDNIGEAVVKLMRANEVYEFTKEKMSENPRLMYQIEGEQ